MKVGLFFGSFNPVHIGHMLIADYLIHNSDLDQIWMVVSPHNPLKTKKSLAKDYDRLHLVQLATEDNPGIKASDIEFGLPKPSYTVDTMAYITEKYPQHEFYLIMGGDSLGSFKKWKNYEVLLEKYNILVYQRPSYDLGDLADHDSISILDSPQFEISATYVRERLKNKKSVRYLVPDAVNAYLEQHPIYG